MRPSAPSNPPAHAPLPVRLPSIHAAVRLLDAAPHAPQDPLARKRRLVADLCRVLGDQLRGRGAGGGTPGNGKVNDDPARHGRAAWNVVLSDEDAPRTPAIAAPTVALSPRMRQTLERLLAGDSEKEIAAHLRLSPHTVHVYVKTLYRRFAVCSRGELLALFVRPAAFLRPHPAGADSALHLNR